MAQRDASAAVPLPSGGGAQESLGQDFEVDLGTGSGSYQVPLAFPPGPRQIRPEISLEYGSGHGNGLAGIGWSLGVPAVVRSEVEGRPAFDDTDGFRFGGQRLVPFGGGRFRPEVETELSRIDRTGPGWEVRRKDGTRLRFGTTAAGRLALPLDRPDPVLEWLLESVEDPLGNVITYSYAHDGGHVRPLEIRYGPYIIHFAYETRPDPVISHRLGFERRQAQRLREVRLALVEGPEEGAERPVKAYRLGYEQAPHSGVSRLATVALVAFDGAVEPPAEDPLPPLRFAYTDPAPREARLRPLRHPDGAPPLTDEGTMLLDLDGIGLPGVMQLSAAGGFYWPNRGALELGPPRPLPRFPSALAERPEQVRVASLSGHGLLDLVVLAGGAGGAGGYYALQPGGAWDPFRPFRRAPAIPLFDERARFVDLDFDGRADLLYADSRAFYAVINRGGGDFAPPRVIPRRRDRAAFPDLDLADPRVHLADMTGGGGAALVEVRDRAVTYWPNLGNGRFGAAVVMAAPPDLPERWDPRHLFLADVDGDGLADLVHAGDRQVSCWFNRGGISFAPPVTLDRTPPPVAVRLVDLLGSGGQGLLWCGPQERGGRRTHWFLDLSGPRKANLLERVTTPQGGEVRIEYGTSVTEAEADRGGEDAADLPFPVQVVRRLEIRDLHTGARSLSEYAYHRGAYDRRQRRFLGFGRVERRDLGEGGAPDRITVTHFHTRPPERATAEALLRHRALARLPYRIEVFGADDPAHPFSVETIDGEAVPLGTGVDGTAVYFAARRRVRQVTTERGAAAVEREVRYEHDAFGNVVLEEEVQRFRDGGDGGGTERVVALSTATRYLAETPAYLVGLPAATVQRDGDGRLLAANRLLYDGEPFQGLPLGQATHGVLVRSEALVFPDALLAEVYGDDPPAMAGLGYFHRDDPDTGPGWWQVEAAQEVDGRGNPVVRRDPLGREIRFAFDAHGIYPVRVENAAGHVALTEFDHRYGQPVRQVGVDGQETRLTYDTHGRLLHLVRPQDLDGQPSLLYERAPFESPPRLTIRERAGTDGGEVTVRHLYFNAGGGPLQTRVELGNGLVEVGPTPIAFARGLPAVERKPCFAAGTAYSADDAPEGTPVTRIRRDALDRPVEIELPGGSRSRRVYAAGGVHHFDAEDLDPASSHFDTPATEIYDAAGRLVAAVERPASGVERTTHYERNPLGLLTGAIDPSGSRLFTQRHDLTGRLVARDHREAGACRYVLDAAGHPVEERRGARRIFREFDPIGRPTALRFGTPGAPPVETRIYDAGPGDNLRGRLARVEGDFGTVAFSYTRCGRLKAKTRTFPGRPGESFTLSYTYDRQGRLRSVTYPDGRTEETGYDLAGRATSAGSAVTAVDYEPAGRFRRITFANGVETTYTYDTAAERIAEVRTGLPEGDSYQHFRYSYDQVGNPARIEDLTTVAGHVRDHRRFTYDALYRLVEAEGREAAGTYHHLYSYDALGNLLTRPEVDGGIELGFAEGRVLTSSAKEVFPYDDLGNLTSLAGWTHTYDALGRLTESSRADGTRASTLYDHEGIRVSVSVASPGGSVRNTCYCDDAYVLADGGLTETYLFFNHRRVAVLRSDGERRLLHEDLQGNPTCFSRLDGGAFAGQIVYYPYGGVALEMGFGAQSRFRYGSHPEVPGTGLLDFGVRVYSPRLGRFLQPDPYVVGRPEAGLRLPRSLHPYAFVIGNPAALVDPHGAWIGSDFAEWGENVIKEKFWGGIKEGAQKAWEGIKEGAGKVWGGVKWLAGGIATVGTMFAMTADAMITWVNPFTWLAYALDQSDSPVASFFSFLVKFARSPLTTLIGLGIGLYGLIAGKVENVHFKKGTIVFEWDTEGSPFSGTTFGGTVHLWSGSVDHPSFQHEIYHTYQYTGYGDFFLPAYAVAGTGGGLLSSALAGEPQWACFSGVSNNNGGGQSRGLLYGNPLEGVAESGSPSANCV